MGVEACRSGDVCRVHGGEGDPPLMALWFAIADPAYLDKTDAAAIHTALGDRRACPALDFGGGLRSGIGAMNAALRAGAIRIGDAGDGPLLARTTGRVVPWASPTIWAATPARWSASSASTATNPPTESRESCGDPSTDNHARSDRRDPGDVRHGVPRVALALQVG